MSEKVETNLTFALSVEDAFTKSFEALQKKASVEGYDRRRFLYLAFLDGITFGLDKAKASAYNGGLPTAQPDPAKKVENIENIP